MNGIRPQFNGSADVLGFRSPEILQQTVVHQITEQGTLAYQTGYQP
eukprot:CAMPEP_0185852456 /NCGR_PEP_ID=MMETSP1354-20130828/14792_1 /TAXON_ID=708628 /ORGANISM="Erythrolobus madagascarensis, Strain CCMP3276" /LENGTH=45 /DNA_ID= /DNA_START= /DNA_END= /DNA_ORIENTATION=